MDAFAPASVTAVFTPTGAGDASRGVSFTLADGVVVSITPADATRVTVDGQDASFAPVEGVLERLGVTAAVDVELEVPIGAGFGSSGAATLATALAANDEFDLGHDRGELVDAAHRSEVAAGTGLGDVFVQDRGGLVYDLGDGRKDVPADDPVAYASYGSIATEELLADDETMALVREHGTSALATFDDPPALRDVLDAGWTFARETGLATDRVTRTVERVRAEGGVATMAMVGETVIALDDGNLPEGKFDSRSRIASEAARLL